MNMIGIRRMWSRPRRNRQAFCPVCEPVEPRLLLTGNKVAYVVSGLGGDICPDQVVAHLTALGFTVHEAAWNDPNPTGPAGPHGSPGSFALEQDTSSLPVSVSFTVDLGSPNTPDKVDPAYGTDFVDSVVN